MSNLAKYLAIFLICISNCFVGQGQIEKKFKLGNEALLDQYTGLLQNQKVAVLTNQTGILSDGTHIVDALISKKINVVKIFTPEHGIRGDEVYSSIDVKTGIPIVSLYGGKYKPDKSDLADVDVLVYDVQDAGARFYTYTSTLYYLIESASDYGKTIYVCDRPVICNPDYVDGFKIEQSFISFVGMIPTPVCYGMTCGELAGFLAGQVYLNKDLVKVIKMEGYNRETEFDSLGLLWVKPSPSMLTSRTAVCYPATCFLEGTNISEGRGTDKPFEYFGAPWLDAQQLSAELNSTGLAGVDFEQIEFTPSEKISAYQPKYFGKLCRGIYINVANKKKFEPVKCGVAILVALNKLSGQFKFDKNNYIDKLAGTDKLRKMVLAGKSYEEITAAWEDDLKIYKKIREKYLLY